MTVMDLLNISYTEESSVLTRVEYHLPCIRIRICPIFGLCTGISRRALLDIVALCLACQTLEPEDQGLFQGGHLFFFSFFLTLVMQNYFIQEIWNYINDKNYTP